MAAEHVLADRLILTPDQVDLSRSPLRCGIGEATYVLGAFNPGFTRLPSGNLLMMVRVAEALSEPVRDGHVRAIRWTAAGYVLDAYPLDEVDVRDPRQFEIKGRHQLILGLTSLSWLLPVELDPAGERVLSIDYERAIEPRATYQDLGVEDARISRIGDGWYMTVCSVSAERHATSLYRSDDARDWRLEGIVLDHQNKDMLLFEGLVGGRFVAMTRPLGEVYFAYPPDDAYVGGPSINLAASPDALHWKPLEAPGLRARRGSTSAMKIGGGSPPVSTPAGWLAVYHGVEPGETVGTYRSFWALLDRDDPTRVLRQADDVPLLEANPALTAGIAHRMYLPTPVVFTTGMVADGDDWLLASGEADLACRITRIGKAAFA